MKKIVSASVASVCLLLVGAGVAIAETYNKVPEGDLQYAQCISRSNKKYDGGDEKSPIRGQNKAQAFCSCVWNETPDNFRGDLLKYSESDAGAKVNKICEKYSNWRD